MGFIPNLILDLLKNPRKHKQSPKGPEKVRPKIKNHLKQNQVMFLVPNTRFLMAFDGFLGVVVGSG